MVQHKTSAVAAVFGVVVQLCVGAVQSKGMSTLISPVDPQMQYIGRFATTTTDAGAPRKLFDQPGCEIRARVVLDHDSFVTATIGQRHLPPPEHPQGNSKNSGFQENAFVVWIDGVRQGVGGFWNATFATSKDQEDQVMYDFNITTAGVPLTAGTLAVFVLID